MECNETFFDTFHDSTKVYMTRSSARRLEIGRGVGRGKTTKSQALITRAPPTTVRCVSTRPFFLRWLSPSTECVEVSTNPAPRLTSAAARFAGEVNVGISLCRTAVCAEAHRVIVRSLGQRLDVLSLALLAERVETERRVEE